jgi:hypothetical protein
LTKAKHRFERAQALHVAAKELAVVSVRKKNTLSNESLKIHSNISGGLY